MHENESILVKVTVVHRHGDRAPYASKTHIDRFMFPSKTEIWMLATLIVAAATYSFIMLATGTYSSQFHGKVTELHNTLASLCAKRSLTTSVIQLYVSLEIHYPSVKKP